jgi:ribose transport system substrate-binding protein
MAHVSVMAHVAVAMISLPILLTGHAAAMAEPMTIAVFTKNRTNPAYAAFRTGADQVARSVGARTLHFVPKNPDNVDEQKAMVEEVLRNKPDIVIFIPVDDVAMVDSVKKLNAAKIPIVLAANSLPGTLSPTSAPMTTRSDTKRHVTCSKSSVVKARSS